MKIDKNTVVDLLGEQGRHDHADRASHDLPDEVDHDERSGLLGGLGLDPQDLIKRVTGR